MSANCKSFHAVWEWAIPSDTGIANCPSFHSGTQSKVGFLYVSLTSKVSHGRKLFISSVVSIAGYQLSSVQFNIYYNGQGISIYIFSFSFHFCCSLPHLLMTATNLRMFVWLLFIVNHVRLSPSLPLSLGMSCSEFCL